MLLPVPVPVPAAILFAILSHPLLYLPATCLYQFHIDSFKKGKKKKKKKKCSYNYFFAESLLINYLI